MYSYHSAWKGYIPMQGGSLHNIMFIAESIIMASI